MIDVSADALEWLGVGVIASAMDPPPYLDTLIRAAIVIAVLRMLYRLNTWSPRAT
jgi:hypothetical protein